MSNRKALVTAAMATALCFSASAVARSSAGEQARSAPPSADAAPIAYLIDGTSGQVLFAREADRRFIPASMTKVMTAFLAFEMIEEGVLAPQQRFTIRPETFRQWSRRGSTMFLPADAKVTVDDLLHGITTVSANDGSIVLAEGAAGSVQAWVAAMNDKAQQLGMANSHFGTPNGWMDGGWTFTSARDLAILGQTMIARHPSKYRHFFGAEGFEYNGIAQRNHDPITGVVKGADGIKSGYTNQAGFGFLGSAHRNGQRLVMVIGGSPSGSVRRDAARSFIEWGFESFVRHPLFEKDARIGKAKVQGGSERKVGLRARGPIHISIPKGDSPQIDLSIQYEGPLQAPISDGEEIAELVIAIEGMPESRVPLFAEKDIIEANPLQRFVNGFMSWFS